MGLKARSPGSLIKTVDVPSVEAAIAEYRGAPDKIAFLAQYERGTRSDYNLVHNGERLPSKAIVAAAYRHMTGKRINGFSGGMSGAALVLVKLGYEVDDATPRNPDWSEDELTLALDLYKRLGLTDQHHAEVVALSDFLRGMGVTFHGSISGSYRNPNGIKLKLANLRAIDPASVALGKVGMRRGNSLERVVWDRYADNLDSLRAAAERIRSHAAAAVVEPEQDDPAVEEEAEEGGITYRLHHLVERSASLRRKKIRQARKSDPQLQCEVCTFSFLNAFGAEGEGFAEVHHTDPLHLAEGTRNTQTKDLSILCANCHRMAHRGGKVRSLAELREMRKAGSAQGAPDT